MSELLPLDLAVLPVLYVGLLLAVRDEPAHQASSLTTNILAIYRIPRVAIIVYFYDWGVVVRSSAAVVLRGGPDLERIIIIN